jgi:hypothetical protein
MDKKGESNGSAELPRLPDSSQASKTSVGFKLPQAHQPENPSGPLKSLPRNSDDSASSDAGKKKNDGQVASGNSNTTGAKVGKRALSPTAQMQASPSGAGQISTTAKRMKFNHPGPADDDARCSCNLPHDRALSITCMGASRSPNWAEVILHVLHTSNYKVYVSVHRDARHADTGRSAPASCSPIPEAHV